MGMLSQGFTLGYSLILPPGGGNRTPSDLSEERVEIPPHERFGHAVGFSAGSTSSHNLTFLRQVLATPSPPKSREPSPGFVQMRFASAAEAGWSPTR